MSKLCIIFSIIRIIEESHFSVYYSTLYDFPGIFFQPIFCSRSKLANLYERSDHYAGRTKWEKVKQLVVHSSDHPVHRNAVAGVLFFRRAEIGGNAILLLVSIFVGHYQRGVNDDRLCRHQAQAKLRHPYFDGRGVRYEYKLDGIHRVSFIFLIGNRHRFLFGAVAQGKPRATG
jgi:hypothetical protein